MAVPARLAVALLILLLAAVTTSTASAALPIVPANADFDFHNGQVTAVNKPPNAIPTAELFDICNIPESPGSFARISASGALSGNCDETTETTFQIHRIQRHQGTLSGQVDAETGVVTWQYSSSYSNVYPDTGTFDNISYVLTGTKTLSTFGGWSGTANYSLTRQCNNGCTRNYSYTGTIQYTVGTDVAITPVNIPKPASINFVYTSQQLTWSSTRPAFADAADDLLFICDEPDVPDVFVALVPSGSVFGECNAINQLGPTLTESVAGHMTGTVDFDTGLLTWQYVSTVSYVHHPSGKKGATAITFSGANQIGSNLQVTGTASYSLARTCTSPIANDCDQQVYAYTGTFKYNATVAAVTTADLSIDHIEVVQVVQDASNTIPLVAEKATIARVFVKSSNPVLGATVTLKANKSGAPESIDDNIVYASSKLSRSDITQSGEFILPIPWTNGALQLEAEVQPPEGVTDSSQANNKKTVSVTFQARQTLEIDYIKVCRKLPSDAQPLCPHGDVNDMELFAQGVFPIAEDDLTYRRIVTPVWIYEHPLDTAADENAFLVALRKRYDFAESNPGVTRSYADQVLAWLPEGLSIDKGAADPKWYDPAGKGHVLYIQKAADLTLELALQAAIAHEVAHNLGRRHPNREPSGCGAVDPGTDWTNPTATIGELGLWVAEKQLMLPTSGDLMSYCSQRWISPYTYKKLFEANFFESAAQAVQPAAETNAIVISGSAKADGSAGTLDPAYIVTTEGTSLPASNPQGNHCLRFTGAGPQTDFCFNLTFKTSEDGDTLTQEAFSLKVALPTGVTRVALRRGATELAAIQASAAAPAVNITAPADGSTWTGQRTITWTGTDGDSNALTYSVFYSADGGVSWFPIAVDATTPTLSLNTDQLQGSTNAMFRVVATDGLKTTTDTTGPITVGTPRLWGDVTCDGALDAGDALRLLRASSGLSLSTSPSCFATGAPVTIATVRGELPWGDVDCTASIDPGDALAVIRALAGITATPPAGCPSAGSSTVATPRPPDL
ncbi:hypothetical protein AYO38_03805 [bacterium SCGC AG-212-C10]|nr:hypothetical protein AYO38_03805 [bacterium SCGC AG-212-C10]